MSKQTKRKMSWEWYAVKVLFESIISGKPTPAKIDENYSNNIKTFEESIIIVKAQSSEHAYKLAEKKAKSAEIDYYNPYDELVRWKFVDSLDSYSIMEDKIISGIEVYSRYIQVPKEMKKKKFFERFFPEVIPQDKGKPDYNFSLRIREFNKIPNSK